MENPTSVKVVAEYAIRNWGSALARVREMRQFGHRDVADRAGVSKAQVKAWERGEGYPSALQLKRLYPSMRVLRQFEDLLPRALVDETRGWVPVAPSVEPPVSLEEVSVQNRVNYATRAEVEKPEPPPKNFGEALRRVRLREGLLAEEAAELIGVAQGSYSRWENGDNYPVRDHYDKLVDLFPELAKAPLPFSRSIPKPAGNPLANGRPPEVPPPVAVITHPMRPNEKPEVVTATVQEVTDALLVAKGRMEQKALVSVGPAALVYGTALYRLALAREDLNRAQVGVSEAEQALKEADEGLKQAAYREAQSPPKTGGTT